MKQPILTIGISGIYLAEQVDSLLHNGTVGVAAIITGINENGTLNLACFPDKVIGNHFVVKRDNIWPDKFTVSTPIVIVEKPATKKKNEQSDGNPTNDTK